MNDENSPNSKRFATNSNFPYKTSKLAIQMNEPKKAVGKCLNFIRSCENARNKHFVVVMCSVQQQKI